jgi:hypothetical protein
LQEELSKSGTISQGVSGTDQDETINSMLGDGLSNILEVLGLKSLG